MGKYAILGVLTLAASAGVRPPGRGVVKRGEAEDL